VISQIINNAIILNLIKICDKNIFMS